MRVSLASVCVTSILSLAGPVAYAAPNIIEYDATSGLLPQNLGWSYSDQANPPASEIVSGGILTLNSAVTNRARWDLNPLPSTPGNAGVFMEATVRIVSEQHTSTSRGIALPQVGHADGVSESGIDLYAWTDRIFVNDFDDVTVGTYFMDTTDQQHTYRVELLLSKYWVFVDDNLVLAGTTPVYPSALNGVGGGFGDGSTFSGGTSEWSTIRLGSLDAINGPTVPEPSTCLLVGLIVGYFCRRRGRPA